MDIDFDKLAALAKTDPTLFEIERKRVIQSHISELPPDRQQAALKFQRDLDLKRLSLDPQDFLLYCSSKMRENLDQLSIQMTALCSELKLF